MKKIILFILPLFLLFTTPVYALETGWYTISDKQNSLHRLSVIEGKVDIENANNQSRQKFLITNVNGKYKIGTGNTVGMSVLAGLEQKKYSGTELWNIEENTDNSYYLQYDNVYLRNNATLDEKPTKWNIIPFTEKFTVTFKEGENTLKRELVAKNKSATAPNMSNKEGFSGWNTDYSNITSNLTVNAVYDEELTPNTWYEIIPVSDTSSRLSVYYNSANSNVNIDIEKANSSNGQKFYLEEDKYGGYTLATGCANNKYVTFDDNNNIYQNTDYCLWNIEEADDNTYEINCNDEYYIGIADSNAVLQNKPQSFIFRKTTAPTGELKYPILFNRQWSYFNYEDLTDTEKQVYDEIVSNLSSNSTSVEVGIGKVTSATSATHIASAIQNTKYYINDFWFKSPANITFMNSYSYNRKNQSIIFNPNKCKTLYNITNEVENFCQNLASSIFIKGMEEREAVSKLNSWIRNNIKYHGGGIFTNTYTGSYRTLDNCSGEYRQPYDLIREKKGNCRAISMFAEIMLDIAGIDSSYETFTDDDSGHMWSYINVEEDWWHYDFTWNLSYSHEKYGLTKTLWNDHSNGYNGETAPNY